MIDPHFAMAIKLRNYPVPHRQQDPHQAVSTIDSSLSNTGEWKQNEDVSIYKNYPNPYQEEGKQNENVSIYIVNS